MLKKQKEEKEVDKKTKSAKSRINWIKRVKQFLFRFNLSTTNISKFFLSILSGTKLNKLILCIAEKKGKKTEASFFFYSLFIINNKNSLTKLFLLIEIFEFLSFISINACKRTLELVDIWTPDPSLVRLSVRPELDLKSVLDCVSNIEDFFNIYFLWFQFNIEI